MLPHTCKQYIFLSYDKSFSVLYVSFDEALSHANAKMLRKEFPISHFIGRFQVTPWQGKG